MCAEVSDDAPVPVLTLSRVLFLASLAAGLTLGSAARAQVTVALQPWRDTTLYESAAGALANGSGEYLFAGLTFQGAEARRRALLAFDVAGAVPSGATILSTELTVNVSQTVAMPDSFVLRRMASDWGEGASDALAMEGAGIAPQTDDATWLHRFFPTMLWATPGGDAASTSSASTVVGGTGLYSWGSTAEMVADVQSWLDVPAGNFGWMLRGPEIFPPTSKRFDSRESSSGISPQLVVTYSLPGLPVTDIPTTSTLAALLLALSLLAAGWRTIGRSP